LEPLLEIEISLLLFSFHHHVSFAEMFVYVSIPWGVVLIIYVEKGSQKLSFEDGQ